jgi:hypothetical protein
MSGAGMESRTETARSESTPHLDPLRRLTALLGEDVFLMPCEWGRSRW